MDSIHEKLLENYEDAQFALLMDEYAQKEGERLWAESEKMKQDPAYALPEGMEERVHAAIKKEFRRKHAKSIAKTCGKVASRVAVVVLALNIAFSAAFISVEAFRVKVLNMVLDYQDTHTTVNFTVDGLESQTEDARFPTVNELMELLPDGYDLTQYEQDGDYELAVLENSDGARIFWGIDTIDMTISVDTEDAEYVGEVIIGNYEGILIEEGGRSTAIWGDTDNQLLYRISADMPYTELLALIEKMYD